VRSLNKSLDKILVSYLKLKQSNLPWIKVAALVVLGHYTLRFLVYKFKQVNEWDLSGKVVLVTGASRGVGKGIATELGKSGAIVYITGRTYDENNDHPLPGTLAETKKIIEEEGGTCIAVKCDHSNDYEVKELFEKIYNEQGKIDVLVNNAFGIPDKTKQSPPFWEQDIELYDSYMTVGPRSNYVAACYAAPMMIKNEKRDSRRGLIININSPGANTTYSMLPMELVNQL